MKKIKIYANIVNFSSPNESLKGKEITCCLTGVKFIRGECLEFRTSEDFKGLDNYVHPKEAEKRGYILTRNAWADLYLYIYNANREEGLLSLLDKKGYVGKIKTIEKISAQGIIEKYEKLSFRKVLSDVCLPF